jgi:hypothetical protein
MDDTAVTAILAVPTDLLGTDTEKFLDVIIDAYPGGDGPNSLDDFVTLVGEREPSFSGAAEEFRENLRADGVDGHWAEIARSFVNDAGSGARLSDLREQFSEESEADDEPADDDVAAETAEEPGGWAAFCAENREFWLGWDGTDWDGWRAAFAEGAAQGQVDGDLAPHLVWMDSLEAAGRLAYLRDTLGFAINEDALAAVSAGAGSGDWAGFCAENRDFWQGWDGADWDGWRAAFAEGAVGAGAGADLDPHLVWMDSLEAAGRLAYLRDTLGFAINEDAFAEVGGTASGGEPAEETQIPADLAGEIAAQVPGFGKLSDEEIAAVVAEALQEAEE